MIKTYFILMIVIAAMLGQACKEGTAVAVHHSNYSGALKKLDLWLQTPEAERETIENSEFATKALSKKEAAIASELIFNYRQQKIKEELKTAWENKAFSYGDKTMKFDYKVFGSKPDDGRSLYISMHGGGGTSAEANDQQWENQKRLYEPAEGVYFVPRAPTNTWNLWHQDHIDPLFQKTVEACVAYLDVNPNKVYIMGYSAGGDGTYQLAPRMADRWAAASMMAGHPNETSPLGLRNIGFAIFMGGNDGAYDRNNIAANWKVKLEELQTADPDGYKHKVTIYEGLGHWMDRKDREALPWLAGFKRNTIPEKVVWLQDDVTHESYYWLNVPKSLAAAKQECVVSYSDNVVNIEKTDISQLNILLNDEMVDLDRKVTIKFEGNEVYQGKVDRTIGNLWRTINERGDKNLAFSGRYEYIK